MAESTIKTDNVNDNEDILGDLSRPSTPAEYIRLFFSGFAMGASDIVPGVSGGTMAFILGIYETLINAIKSFNLQAAQMALNILRPSEDKPKNDDNPIMELVDHLHIRFLIPLGLGLVIAIFALASLLEGMIHDQPQYIFAFFGGLIIASVIAIGAKVEWNPVAAGALIVGAVVAFLITGATPAVSEASLPLLFLSGMIAICAMILPGISGSFILLILGQYENVLGAVRNFELVKIFTVAAGAGVGIIIFSRILSWLLDRYENPTVALLVGFMLGSMRLIVFRTTNYVDDSVIPAVNTPIEFTGVMIALSLTGALIGFFFVTVIDHVQSRENPVLRIFTGGRAA